jgi:hypothetical protein
MVNRQNLRRLRLRLFDFVVGALRRLPFRIARDLVTHFLFASLDGSPNFRIKQCGQNATKGLAAILNAEQIFPRAPGVFKTALSKSIQENFTTIKRVENVGRFVVAHFCHLVGR